MSRMKEFLADIQEQVLNAALDGVQSVFVVVEEDLFDSGFKVLFEGLDVVVRVSVEEPH